MRKKWEPSIEQDNRASYEALIKHVDDSLLSKYTSLLSNPYYYVNAGMGVMGGVSGELLYLFYSSIRRDDEALYDIALKNIELAVSVAHQDTINTFCTGLPGLVWTLYHLENKKIIPGAGGMIDDELIDKFCINCINEIENCNYDYMHGGLGMAIPLLESKRRTDRQNEYLATMVEALAKTAIREDNKVYWNSVFEKEKPEELCVSMGLSHGLPGVIAILSKICQQGIAVVECKDLIEKTINFIFDKKLNLSYSSLYPTRYRHNEAEIPNSGSGRVSWCYGDINIAIGLLYAYKVIKKKEYKDQADSILQFIAKHNDINSYYTTDGSFCHGACGNGHMFNRLYNYTGNKQFRELANFWFGKLDEKVKYENEKLKIISVINKEPTWSDNTNLIMGTAGLGLTLLSAVDNIRPDWDDIFLLKLQ